MLLIYYYFLIDSSSVYRPATVIFSYEVLMTERTFAYNNEKNVFVVCLLYSQLLQETHINYRLQFLK